MTAFNIVRFCVSWSQDFVVRPRGRMVRMRSNRP